MFSIQWGKESFSLSFSQRSWFCYTINSAAVNSQTLYLIGWKQCFLVLRKFITAKSENKNVDHLSIWSWQFSLNSLWQDWDQSGGAGKGRIVLYFFCSRDGCLSAVWGFVFVWKFISLSIHTTFPFHELTMSKRWIKPVCYYRNKYTWFITIHICEQLLAIVAQFKYILQIITRKLTSK